MVRCGPYPVAGPRGPLDRVAQIAERKYCRPEARPFRLGFPRKVPVFPICSPAALEPCQWSSAMPTARHRSSAFLDVLFLPLLGAHGLIRDGINDVSVLRA